ncbi:MAG TPA: LysM peptidoglycan-binding domain-containing protein [Firmicutes bacterium]|jgi:N-acetylmuramoyl-L-alanine amidase|nr:LysM peptidoglycan-binding domain-containing protein [Bacillota bacterium]
MVLIIALIIFLMTFSAPAQVAEQVYIVQPGDTLSEIAQEYNLDWRYLAEFNNINDPKRMRAGMRLRIPSRVYVVDFTPEERDLLARLIHAEARGESLEGQIAVGAVVINRVKSDKFPNTITEVIYQKGQFSPISMGTMPKVPQDSAIEAAERALAGEDPTGGALFFYNPKTTAAPDFWKTRPVIKRIGNHNFAI